MPERGGRELRREGAEGAGVSAQDGGAGDQEQPVREVPDRRAYAWGYAAKFPFELKVELSDIEEIFLEKDEKWSEDKIKKRGQNNSFTYQRKYRGRQNETGDYVQEIRKPLTSLQYVMLREEKADKNSHVVNRQRYSFIYNDLPYAVDVYENIYGRPKTYILRFANKKELDPASLIPDFITAHENVRTDPRFSLGSIAKL